VYPAAMVDAYAALLWLAAGEKSGAPSPSPSITQHHLVPRASCSGGEWVWSRASTLNKPLP
jgi:hypothetical protein